MSATVHVGPAQGLVDQIAAAVKIGGRGGLALRPALPCWTRENTLRRLGVEHEFRPAALHHGPAHRPGRRVWESADALGTLHRCSWCGGPAVVVTVGDDHPAEHVYEVYDPRYAEAIEAANRAALRDPWFAWRHEARAAVDPSPRAGEQLRQLLDHVRADYGRIVAERGCA